VCLLKPLLKGYGHQYVNPRCNAEVVVIVSIGEEYPG
jgi:hypothetical protein